MDELDKTDLMPKMMTIRQIAETGLMPEHALRTLVKQDRIPFLQCGNKVYINLNRLISILNNL